MISIKKLLQLHKQYGQPPGPPPRPGLQWNPQSHRWIRPKVTREERIEQFKVQLNLEI